jgi:mono/diheme cytochrome c family protein
MMANIFIWLVLAAIAALFAWLVFRAWHSPRWYIKWPGTVLGGLLSLILIAVCAASLVGFAKLYRTQGSPVQLTVASTSEQVQRGQYLANAFCVACHSQTGDLPLTGGVDLAKDSPIPLGSMISINLTPAGPLKGWTDGEIFRLLRQGIDRNGRMSLAMSTVNARFMSDEDLKAVIAFLRSQPAVQYATQDPPDQLNFLGLLIGGLGLIPALPEVNGTIIAPPKAATAEYGAYVISYQDCRSCHGADLTGGTDPLSPKGPSLRVVKGWTKDQFIATMRTGVDPGGHAILNPMPWKFVGRMDDVDLGALYQYLISLK